MFSNIFLTILTLLLPLLGSPAFAFINVESVRLRRAEEALGEVQLKWAGQSGNTDKVTLNLDSLNLYRLERDEILFLGSYAYAVTSGTRDTNKGQAHLRYTFSFREKLSYEMFLQTESDEFKDLNSRHLLGSNLRWEILRKDTTALYLGSGIFYEIQDYRGRPIRKAFRGNLYASFVEKLRENLSFSTTLYYQPRIDIFSDFRIRWQNSLDFKINDRLKLAFEYSLAHDNFVPHPEIEKTDTTYLTGLSATY